MNLSLTSDMENFVREKVRSGEFPTEAAVVEAALRRFKEKEAPSVDDFIDHEFVSFCAHEGGDVPTLDEVLCAMSTIPGSMAQTIIEEERADRF